MEKTQDNNASTKPEELRKFPGELYVKNVHKSFGVTKALNDVSFTGYFGEIHAIIGGNGCGKSTLAKVLAGVLPIDSGKVSINGAHPSTPKESRDLGLAMVFQEVLVADEATVVDNLFIGTDGFITKSLSDSEKQAKARSLLKELADEDIDPLTPAGNLPLSIKAWITIARALLSEPKVLVLDESSAALDFDSTERLFDKMRELRDKGVAIIIVTHRIAELVRISDRCTVLRDGIEVGVLEKQEINEENLLRLMTGQEQANKSDKDGAHKTTSTQVSLRTHNMQVWSNSKKSNFELLKGEIVGITGLDGHGQDDFVRILAGVALAHDGYTEVGTNHGKDYFAIKGLNDAKQHDIAFVSGDRKKEGILPNLSIIENLAISMYASNTKVPGARLIEWDAISDIFDWEVERLAIKTGPKENLITSLSGGNQQKVMLGRAFATHPKILILLDPARGIDLQTKRDLYKQLKEFADDGNSVIYMSTELEEFIGFCSRVMVFRNGSIYESFIDEQIEGDVILGSMFGHVQDDHPTKKKNSPTAEITQKHVVSSPASTQKEIDNDKLEDSVNKYNVSNHLNSESENLGKRNKIGGDFSATDEQNFKAILAPYEGRKPSDTGSEIEQEKSKNNNPNYSENDTASFNTLMNQENLINSSRRHNNANLAKREYTNADEQSFDKLLPSTKNKTTANTFISNPNVEKKPTQPERNKDFNTKSTSFQYSTEDIEKFEKILSKK